MSLYDAWLAANDAERALQRTAVTFEEWRTHHHWKRTQVTPDREHFSGHTTLDSYEYRREPIGFTEVEAWGDQPFRVVWASAEHRAIITFTEGDLDLDVCATDEAFRREWSRHNDFYRRTR